MRCSFVCGVCDMCREFGMGVFVCVGFMYVCGVVVRVFGVRVCALCFCVWWRVWCVYGMFVGWCVRGVFVVWCLCVRCVCVDCVWCVFVCVWVVRMLGLCLCVVCLYV